MTHPNQPPILRAAPLLTALLILVSCDLMQEPKLPTWTNKVEIPLIQTSVNLETLEDQDNIISQIYDEDGDRTIFAYADTATMDSQVVGEQLAFGDITQSFSQAVDDVTVSGSSIHQSNAFDAVGVDPIEKVIQSELGTINLADIPSTTTDPFRLNEIVPSVNDIPDGTTTSIPEGDLTPVEKPFTFCDFSSADFASGMLDITIDNDMVIALGSPINIQLQQIDGTDTTNIPNFISTTEKESSQTTLNRFVRIGAGMSRSIEDHGGPCRSSFIRQPLHPSHFQSKSNNFSIYS